MTDVSLLGPSGKPMVALGGATAWRTRRLRSGIYCSFQWIDLRDQGFEATPEHAAVACMCLFRPHVMEAGSYAIPQPHAFLFGTKQGHPTPHLLTSAWQIAQDLGFDMRDKQAIRQIIDIVIEGLPDLVLMPSEPPEGSDAAARKTIYGIEARAKINGVVIHEELL